MPAIRRSAALVVALLFTAACGADLPEQEPAAGPSDAPSAAESLPSTPAGPQTASPTPSPAATPSITPSAAPTDESGGGVAEATPDPATAQPSVAAPPSGATLPPTAPGAPTGSFAVAAVGETEPVAHSGDAADDPAIWVDPADPSRSVIIGTDKQDGGGLLLYDLAGRQIGAQNDGPMNNVDVRGDLVVAGNESDNTIAVYRMDPAGPRLVPAASGVLRPDLVIYGTCLYRSSATGRLYAVVTSEKGEVEQWHLFDAGGGAIGGSRVRSFSLGSQTEGCVADDAHGALYVGEEAVGIWRFDAEPDAGDEGVLIDTTGGGGHLRADVEGLTIAAYADGTGFLIASSQGNNEYVLYERTTGAYLATFRIEDGAVDGTSDTDGIDVTTIALGPAYPAGLFVAQDGKNDDGRQNFKLVSLGDVLR